MKAVFPRDRRTPIHFSQLEVKLGEPVSIEQRAPESAPSEPGSHAHLEELPRFAGTPQGVADFFGIKLPRDF